MWGAAVIVSSDDDWKPRSIQSNSKPAARIAASVSRVVRQPPSDRVQKSESTACCTARNGACGDADVLVHAQLAAGGEDARGSRRSASAGSGTLHSTQIGDDGVERAVRGRQPLGEPLDDLDRHRRLARPFSGGDAGRRVGLDREHGLDLRPVVLERTPLAAADLDHPPAAARVRSRRRSAAEASSGWRSSRHSSSRANRDCPGP